MTTKLINPVSKPALGGLINNANFPDGQHRPDLSNKILVRSLIGLLVLATNVIVITPFTPGTPLGQILAALGALLLCAPLIFAVMKRSGRSASPPLWFCVHVICSSFGLLFISAHVANGDWLTPPGIVLASLFFLVIQGALARVFVGQRLSYLFARSAASFNFTRPVEVDRTALREIITRKVNLLETLDRAADEALFSPTLKHWCKHPFLSFRYQQLITKESRLVGARQRAGWLLRCWRRLHILAAVCFAIGLLAHVIVMLFFAGYAADGGAITWWHIASWGGK